MSIRFIQLSLGLALIGWLGAYAEEADAPPVRTDPDADQVLSEASAAAAAYARDGSRAAECLRACRTLLDKHAQTLSRERWNGDGGPAERSFGPGVYRTQAWRAAAVLAQFLTSLAEKPSADAPRADVLRALFDAQIKSAQWKAASETLQNLEQALAAGNAGTLRVGDAEGQAALAVLREEMGQRAVPEEAEAEPAAPPDLHLTGLKKMWDASLSKLAAGKDWDPDEESKAQDRAEASLVGAQDMANLPARVLADHVMFMPFDAGIFVGDATQAAAFKTGHGAPGEATFRIPLHRQESTQPTTRWTSRACAVGDGRLYLLQGAEPCELACADGNAEPLKALPSNGLASYALNPAEMTNGQHVWTLSDEKGTPNTPEDRAWLNATFFCDGPAFSHGRLFALGIRNRNEGAWDSFLMAFDAASGRLLWKTFLGRGAERTLRGKIQPAPGLPVTVAGGTVYAVSNLGTAAAVDARSGHLQWLRVYDRTPPSEARQTFDQWAPQAPLVYRDLVLVAPQDAGYLWAINRTTGARTWEVLRKWEDFVGRSPNRPAFQYIVGVHEPHLILAGNDILFIRLDSGRHDVRAPLKVDIVGLGVITRDELWVPCENGIHVVDLTPTVKSGRPSCKVIGFQRWSIPETEDGHLRLHGHTLYSISSTHLVAYEVRSGTAPNAAPIKPAAGTRIEELEKQR